VPSLAALIDQYEHPGRQVGASCKNGHERAVHERRYGSRRSSIRVCLACQRDREKQDRAERRERRAYHPDDLRWAEFCRTIDQRIAEMREDAPATCPDCSAVNGTRRCSRCQQVKRLDDFPRDRCHALGFSYRCKACANAENRARRREQKRKQIRAALGRSA
jgi:hypothetical protein